MVEMKIYLRPLQEEDAKVSFRWRNNPEVWKNTGAAPDCFITEEIETAWIRKALQDPTTKRYAICLKGNDQYIGNAYLSNISNGRAEEQIFIGEPTLWNQGIGTQARALLYRIAAEEFKLSIVVSNIRTRNIASLKSVLKLGFHEVARDSEWINLEKNLDPLVHGGEGTSPLE